ncbi:MAG: hypothetical protein WKG07_17530 [Hymenobacter sp.]
MRPLVCLFDAYYPLHYYPEARRGRGSLGPGPDGHGPARLRRVAGLRSPAAGQWGRQWLWLLPNLQRYGFMATWDQAEDAASFFATGPTWAAYQERSLETWTAELAPPQAHGAWNGSNLFAEGLAAPGG